MKTNDLRKTQAITLIALVVTIVVLLILAGVSIAVLTGENGILNRATEAKQTNEQKTAEEELKLGIVALSTDYYSKTTRPATFREFIFSEDSKTKLNQELNGGATFNSTNYTITYKGATHQVDENGNLGKVEGLILRDTLSLIKGLDTTFQLEVEQLNISASALTWTSSNPAVATVDNTGNIIVVTTNNTDTETTTIAVSGLYNNKNYSAQCIVTIVPVTISIEDIDVIIDNSEVITPKIIPESVTTRDNITINWTSGTTSVATISPSAGASTIVSVPSGVTANSTSIITVTIKNGTTTLSEDTCTVRAIISPWIDNSYVQYNVEYADVYTGTWYNKNTGWRILTKIEEDAEHYDAQAGTYEGDLEIISTGIPAKLYYDCYTIKNFEKANDNQGNLIKGKWAGTESQRKKFLTEYSFPNRTYEDKGIYAAAGLIYNFTNIVFNVQGTKDTLEKSNGKAFEDKKNYGGYIDIRKKEEKNGIIATDETTGEDLFKTIIENGVVSGIRSISFKDITGSSDSSSISMISNECDYRQALFNLYNYTPAPCPAAKNYYYAAPGIDADSLSYGDLYSRKLFLIQSWPTIQPLMASDGEVYGVRPVISITGARLKLKGHVWEFSEN